MAGGGHGELSRGGAPRGQAGPLPAVAARVLRAGAEVRAPGQVVRLHRQGQPAQRLAHALRSQHIPGTGASATTKPNCCLFSFNCQCFGLRCHLAPTFERKFFFYRRVIVYRMPRESK